MSRWIANLTFAAALGLVTTVGLAGVASAGPTFDCGNGVVEPPEQCDDSNEVTGDGCSFPSCLPEVCGDEITNPDPPSNEECDDGNTTPGDGCDENCQDEPDPQLKPQQNCINGINKNELGVVKAANKGAGKCLKDVAKGAQADLPACLAAVDTTKAEGKTTATATNKCGGEGAPDFAFTDAATVNTAATTASSNLFTEIFGDPATVADKEADQAGAACQAEVLKRAAKLQETWLAEANKAKKAALKSTNSTPGVNTDEALAAAIDTGVGASTKIDKAETALTNGIGKKCAGVDIQGLFDCDDAADGTALGTCAIQAAEREACVALETGDDLDLACPGDA